ncbi:MAG: hypothetical protein KDE14_02240, partial [Rhodobacteraceae bacterium]|nr:hypothetical protein [Paracoccaceae bacterium]
MIEDLSLPVLVGLAAAALLIPPAAWLVWRQHRHWRAAERAQQDAEREARTVRAALETAPEGYFAWIYRRDAAGTVAMADAVGECSRRLAVLLDLYRGRDSSFDDILECFAQGSQEQFGDAIGRLREDGVGFALDLTLASGGRRIAARGLRATGDD